MAKRSTRLVVRMSVYFALLILVWFAYGTFSDNWEMYILGSWKMYAIYMSIAMLLFLSIEVFWPRKK